MRRKLFAACALSFSVFASSAGISAVHALTMNDGEYIPPKTPAYVPINPFWQNIESSQVDLTFNGTTAHGSVFVQGFAGSTIGGTARLERVNANGTFTLLRSWSVSSSTNRLTFNGTHTVTRGYEYRFSVTTTVTRNGISETVTTETRRILN